uniref:Uncharacterized protein n=1 Tax=Arundo donax TaxID=35708 RepID=A0A0A8ZAE6_ARUDO
MKTHISELYCSSITRGVVHHTCT